MAHRSALGVVSLFLAAAAPGAAPAPQVTRESLRVLVPAYFYPVANSPWTRLDAMAAAHPGRVAAIGNPASGPGATVDPSYVAAFHSFRASGGSLLGYVRTAYGARPIADVKQDVDAWIAWYGVDGIFFDEMNNVVGASEAYYHELFAYVKSRVARPLVVGNPGVSTPPSYLTWNGKAVVSTLRIHENSSNFLAWRADVWTQSQPRSSFYVLPYAVGAGAWQAAVDHAYSERCGWIYVTNDVLPNPWDTLPSYFESMVAYIASTY